MSTLKRFAGQTAIYGFSNILSRTLNFILTPLYLGLFATSAYGVFTLLFSWTSIVAAFLSLGMETTYFRFLNKSDDKKQVFQNSFLTLSLTAILFGLTALLFFPQIIQYFQKDISTSQIDYTPFLYFFLGFIILDNLNVIPFARLRSENRPLRYGIIKTSGILIFIGLNLFFLLALPHLASLKGPLGTFFNHFYIPHWIGYVFISNLIMSAYSLLWLSPYLKDIRLKMDWTLFKSMLSYSWPILIANLSYIINENLDKIYLKALLPQKDMLKQLGIYSACYKLAIFLNLFIQAFRLGAEPFFFSHASHPDSKKTYAQIMYYFVMVVALISLGILANISWLKYFLHDSRYWVGLDVVPILVYGYVCLGIYMNLSVWYKLSDQTQFGFYISGIGALITLILNPILIPFMGYMGSAWTTLGAYFIMMLISYIWGQKFYPIPYPLGKIVLILILSLLLSICSFSFFHQNFWWGNFCLIVFIGFLFFMNRKDWLRGFQALKNKESLKI